MWKLTSICHPGYPKHLSQLQRKNQQQNYLNHCHLVVEEGLFHLVLLLLVTKNPIQNSCKFQAMWIHNQVSKRTTITNMIALLYQTFIYLIQSQHRPPIAQPALLDTNNERFSTDLRQACYAKTQFWIFIINNLL